MNGMKILAIDSSGMPASAALAEDDQLIAEYTIYYKKTHSQTLLPMIDQIRQMTQLDLTSLDAVAVAAGPGSFTGLRIGSATAKGLGLALDLPLIPVPTLEGLAWNVWGTDRVICPMMDARRDQVYTGAYRFRYEQDGTADLESLIPQDALPVEEMAGKLNMLHEPVILLGDGVPVYRQILEKTLRVPVLYAPAHMNRQKAGSVAACAFSYARKGRMESAAAHRPDYLRVSQAERERAQRLKGE